MASVPSDAPVLTLVDASGFIFRAYHAIQHLSTSRGVSTNAVYGFTRMMLKTLREEAPTHLALAFDKDSRRGRQAIDPTYKAHREAPPPDLAEQFALVREVSDALGLHRLEVPGWEADDIIATLTRQALAQGFRVRVITGDKDFVQLVQDGVELYDPMQERTTRAPDVQERLGIRPDQMRDYLALIGDAVDNVAKVPGVGPKTAVELLGQFGDVETLLSRLDEVKKPKIRDALSSNAESLQRAKRLVTFKDDLELPLGPGQLTVRPANVERLRQLFTELEFYKLLQELPGMAPPAAASPAAHAAPEVPTPVLADAAALTGFLARAREAGRLALVPAQDAGRLVGLGLALPDGARAYLPLAHTALAAGGQLAPEQARALLAPVLGDAAVVKAGHDLKALMRMLTREGLPLEGARDDVELLSYLLNPSRREHALADLARERLQVELPVLATGKRTSPLAERTAEEVAPWAGASADTALRLVAPLWEDLERAGLAKLARDIEVPLLPILARMELRGVKLDTSVLGRISERVDAEVAAMEKEIHRLAGHEFNVGSNQQLAQVLFVELKLPVLKRGKTGPSADLEVLEKLSEMHALPRAIIEYRTISKLKSTYLDTLPGLVAADGRVHTTFHQVVAATGRLSSSDPNLQNIPVRTELGREIRRAFVAEEGHRLVSADYSQVELRLLAHIAEDPGLLQAFHEDADVHQRTASEIFGVPAGEVTPDMRRVAKTVNFGIAYGLSPHGLSARLGISQEEARDIIDRYFARYAGIRRYLEETVERARKVGYVETLFGRRRLMADLHSKNRAAAQAAERAAINMPIQGTAADLIKMAMIAVEKALVDEGLKARMILQVHDELLFEAPEAEVARVEALARRHMSGVAQLQVPLKVEVGSGTTWADAH